MDAATPLQIRFGEKGSIEFSRPTSISLVPDSGLRIVCAANFHWPVLGIGIPISIRELTVLLRPEIDKGRETGPLVFRAVIEDADLVGVTDTIDAHIVDKVNEELVSNHMNLSWDFAKTLSYSFKLPATIASISTLDLKVSWSRVHVTSEALVWAVAYTFDGHAAIEHYGLDRRATLDAVSRLRPGRAFPPRDGSRGESKPFFKARFHGVVRRLRRPSSPRQFILQRSKRRLSCCSSSSL